MINKNFNLMNNINLNNNTSSNSNIISWTNNSGVNTALQNLCDIYSSITNSSFIINLYSSLVNGIQFRYLNNIIASISTTGELTCNQSKYYFTSGNGSVIETLKYSKNDNLGSNKGTATIITGSSAQDINNGFICSVPTNWNKETGIFTVSIAGKYNLCLTLVITGAAINTRINLKFGSITNILVYSTNILFAGESVISFHYMGPLKVNDSVFFTIGSSSTTLIPSISLTFGNNNYTNLSIYRLG
jgi:hypothetical protein